MTQTAPAFDVGTMMAFEDGELSEDETISFFQILIDTGVAWELQGSYGRTAAALIANGFCQPPQKEDE